MTQRNGEIRDPRPEVYREHLRLSAELQMAQIAPRLRAKFGASDVVQKTMMKACSRLEQFRGRTTGEFVAWLQRILSNVLADEVRRFTGPCRDVDRERSLERFVESSRRIGRWLADERFTPDGRAVRREELERLVRALAALPDDQHEVLVLRYCLGWSLKHITRHVDRSRASVAGLLRRGLERLRRELRED